MATTVETSLERFDSFVQKHDKHRSLTENLPMSRTLDAMDLGGNLPRYRAPRPSPAKRWTSVFLPFDLDSLTTFANQHIMGTVTEPANATDTGELKSTSKKIRWMRPPVCDSNLLDAEPQEMVEHGRNPMLNLNLGYVPVTTDRGESLNDEDVADSVTGSPQDKRLSPWGRCKKMFGCFTKKPAGDSF